MKILITGGAGFIGSALIKRLLQTSCVPGDITVIDNFSTGKKDSIPKGVEVVEYTLGSFSDDITTTFIADCVVHLAALPRVGRSLDNPVETHYANVNGTLEALEMARRSGIKNFVYASSSSVYGAQDVEQLPAKEEAETNPMNPYATQKLIGEEYCKIYNKVFEMRCIMLRFFNVYGPGMATEGAYKLVFSNWIEQIKQGKRLTIYGDGEQTRDFTYIDDIVEGIIKAIEYDLEVPFYLPFNLCTGKETSVLELSRQFNWGIDFIQNPRPNEENRKYGSYERAKNLLGWVPKVNIYEGVKAIREYYEV